METRLYVVYDKLAEESGPIFQAPNDAVALRQYRGLLQQVAQPNVDDYDLYMIGHFDNKKMWIESEEKPIKIVIDDPTVELFGRGRVVE